MALPVILVDSATGSDTAASGAGPATALSGSVAVSSADGLTIAMVADAPDLSGVATDGSAVFYFADPTAGNRNFVKITAVDNTVGVKTVTVANAVGFTLTKAWAIGGKRATIAGTASIKLLTNNAGVGDTKPGWVVEMQSGHSETIAATLNPRGAGTSAGQVWLRGASGAAVRPLLTFSNNGIAIQPGSTGTNWWFTDFELQNSNATKTASVGFSFSSGTPNYVRNVKINHSTNKFWKGVQSGQFIIDDCDIGNCANVGVEINAAGCEVINCWIHACGANGINLLTGSYNGSQILNNIIAENTGDGINDARTMTTIPTGNLIINGNTIDANTGDGFKSTCTSSQSTLEFASILNNIFSNNSGGYGINFSGAGMADAVLAYLLTRIRGNNFYNNTSGKYTGMTVTSSLAETTTDPTFANAAGRDYSIGTNLKAKGYPLGGTLPIGTTSSTYSHVDPGAAQRQEAGSVAYFPVKTILIEEVENQG